MLKTMYFLKEQLHKVSYPTCPNSCVDNGGSCSLNFTITTDLLNATGLLLQDLSTNLSDTLMATMENDVALTTVSFDESTTTAQSPTADMKSYFERVGKTFLRHTSLDVVIGRLCDAIPYAHRWFPQLFEKRHIQRVLYSFGSVRHEFELNEYHQWRHRLVNKPHQFLHSRQNLEAITFSTISQRCWQQTVAGCHKRCQCCRPDHPVWRQQSNCKSAS